MSSAGGSISVIVPALDEAAGIAYAVKRALPGAGEVIVVDGASADGTPEVAAAAGARVIAASRGRGAQMNAGARYARGETLLFLHADALLPVGYDDEVRRLLADPRIAAGAFSTRLDGPGLACRLIERGTNWRSRLLDLPYGDQGIFLRAALFHRLGGFPEVPLLEDLILVRALRRQGRIAISPAAMLVSARRLRERGPWRTFLRNQGILLGYLLGRPVEQLAHWYRR